MRSRFNLEGLLPSTTRSPRTRSSSSSQPFDQIVALLGTNRNAAFKLGHDARRALKSALAAEGISEETIRTAFTQ